MAQEITTPAELWRDSAAPSADRVKDLISRLTLRQKVAHLYGIWVGADATLGQVAPFQHSSELPAADWSDVLRDGVGQLTRPFGTAPVDPVAGARGGQHATGAGRLGPGDPGAGARGVPDRPRGLAGHDLSLAAVLGRELRPGT